jgi:acetyltransferase
MTFAIRRFSAADLNAHLEQFVELLTDAVSHGASVSFVAPLQADHARTFWRGVLVDVENGHTILVAALDQNRVIGSAQILLAWQPNGTHRAEVAKVLVHSTNRRQGVGTLLMRTVEEQARGAHRSLLVLDTEAGGSGQALYESLGYQRAGSIPRYALSNDGQSFVDTILYYKLLG